MWAQLISRHLAIFGQLIESETVSFEPFGDDVFKTDESSVADKEDAGRAGGERSLHHSFSTILG
jgi:hypothetical protein